MVFNTYIFVFRKTQKLKELIRLILLVKKERGRYMIMILIYLTGINDEFFFYKIQRNRFERFIFLHRGFNDMIFF